MLAGTGWPVCDHLRSIMLFASMTDESQGPVSSKGCLSDICFKRQAVRFGTGDFSGFTTLADRNCVYHSTGTRWERFKQVRFPRMAKRKVDCDGLF